MDSDLDIARRAEPRPIEEIAAKLGLSSSDLIMQGPTVAKIILGFYEI
jgi:formyltetrahydrofolate synthetase